MFFPPNPNSTQSSQMPSLMNPKTHFFISLAFFLLLLLLLVPHKVVSDDPKFENCRSAYNCGSGVNIRYPFWVQGHQKPYCGLPGFNISCKNSKPVLKISSNDYAIVDIDYNNQSLRVSNFEAFGSTCTIPIVSHNLTFNQTPFKLGVAHVDLFLFSNCSASFPNEYSTYSINCSGNNSTGNRRSFVLFGKDKALSYVNQAGKCDSLVIAPVDSSWNGNVSGNANRGYKFVTAVLNKGFQLTWSASRCEVCNNSGGICGFDYSMYTFACFCPDRPHAKWCREGRHKGLRIAIGLGYSIVAALVVVMGVGVLYLLRRSKNHPNVEEFLRNHRSLSPKRYKYFDVRKMTNSFKEKLGQGGYGSVFKGQLLDGRLVAVKVLDKTNKGDGEDFFNEIASISRTSHVNVVALLGFCIEGPKRALIYEFMPNGSLEKFIYNDKLSKTGFQDNQQLGWDTLFKITIGIARGLEYLHRGCYTRIVHFDIKPHNILLDQDFNPKISDFGLSKLCLKKESTMSTMGARGTIGYIAPELVLRTFGKVSHRSDVYSFGMMVLEMVGQRKNVDAAADNTSEIYFPHWIYKRLDQLEELGLGTTTTEDDKELARKMTIVGLWCIQVDPMHRPSMNKVLDMLVGRIEDLEIPPMPTFFSSAPSVHQ